MTTRLCVLLACHNRRDTTLACLARLADQVHPGVEREVFLVDDGSPDGTGDAVRREFPAVHVLDGTGSLYWGGAMRLADATAWETRPDHLLWLNDDVDLAAGAIHTLVTTAATVADRAVVVGALADPVTGDLTYGGYRRPDPRRPLGLRPVVPSARAEWLDTMNGNLVLVPAGVRASVGPLDPRFSHNMADMDFGFRVRAAGFALLLAPGLLGTCTLNRDKSRWSDPTLSPVERLRRVRRFDGLPPREWWVFTRRHGGVRWARHFVAPYLRAAAAGPAARWSDRHERRLVGLPQADEGHA